MRVARPHAANGFGAGGMPGIPAVSLAREVAADLGFTETMNKIN